MNETIKNPAGTQPASAPAPVACCDASDGRSAASQSQQANCCPPAEAPLRERTDVGGRCPSRFAAPPRPAAEPMWSELHERLRAFVARRVPDRVVVDDLAQEIMLRLYTQMGRLRDRDRLDAWAYQVARNVIADYWRDRAADRELPLDEQLSERSRPCRSSTARRGG